MAERRYLNTSLSYEERARDLVRRMTLEEKVSQMIHPAASVERLGVPEYNWWNECLHGVARAGIATVFPQAIGLAATWDTDLMLKVATAISDEARAKHHDFLRQEVRLIYTGLTFWSPNINIFRDPRWGRGHETYGECPYLTARLGVAFVKGLQGDDPHYLKLVATAKHFAVHSGPERDRHHFDARASERDLRETYLPAFEALVKEGGVWSVMGAYNRTNGEACCASPTLLQKILRDEWGFQGYVVSDCAAIDDIWKYHGLATDAAEAAALGVKNGCELNCGATYPALLEAEERGLISEETITQAVESLFRARFRLGMFDPPDKVPYASIPIDVVASPAHRALALQAARESIVMLKYTAAALPLDKRIKSIAVIGPNADDRQPLLGNYNGTPTNAVTPLEGIRRKVGETATVYYARGSRMAEGVPALEPIPAAYLRPSGGNASERGLSAAYFRGVKFEDDPVRSCIDPVIDFYWQGLSPLRDGALKPFSVRWSGQLCPPKSGAYALGVTGYTGYALYLDGELIVRSENEHHNSLRHKLVDLEAGRLYGIRLEYWNRHPAPEVHLLWEIPGTDYLAPALAAARHADVTVAVLGLSQDIEGEEMPVSVPGFDRGDRTDLALPAPQQTLLEELHRLGKPLILVLLAGSAMSLTWADNNVAAILAAWYPGEEGGTAIADVLFGDYSPAGRLPVTFYRSVNDLPAFDDYNMEGHTYRYFRGEPLYHFGHGLSYTSFSYSKLALSDSSIRQNQGVSASVDVCNTGAVAGDEVVQLYITDLEASVPVPIRQLQGFRRLHLAAGETKTVAFDLTPRQFSLIDSTGKRVVEPGDFLIAAGGQQPTKAALETPGAAVAATLTITA